ncbi:MAG: ATP-binding protein [Tepidisphaeraceae bacterium]|jgi:signal transduction histidine kinase
MSEHSFQTSQAYPDNDLHRHHQHLESLVAQQNAELHRARQQLEHEIAERKRIESQMILLDKLASLGQLVAMIAHEINNPLSYVINNVATLQRDISAMTQLLALYQQCESALAGHPDLLQSIRDYSAPFDMPQTVNFLAGTITATREGLVRIKNIVANICAFSRLDENMTLADLNIGIHSTADMLHHKAHTGKVEIELELNPLPRIQCRPSRICQVIMNLVSNAIDASPAGGKVTIRSASQDDGVRVEVIDHGTGMSPDIRSKIFHPFFTTKPPGKGTGLGLSISNGIIRDHGGRIEVDSEPGRGSRFVVWIPKQRKVA